MPGRKKRTVTCNTCGKNITVNPGYKREGELEYRYFVCRKCKAVYVISVTDEALRENIRRYQELTGKGQGKELPPETLQEVRLILKNNAERSRRLREAHPLVLKPWER